jgi:hypothetical protein
VAIEEYFKEGSDQLKKTTERGVTRLEKIAGMFGQN